MSLLGSIASIGGMVIGGIIGGLITGGNPAGIIAGASIGGALGGFSGSLLFPEQMDLYLPPPPQPRESRLQISTYGAAIPVVYGSGRLAGNIIYMQDVLETIERSRHRNNGVRYYEMVKTYTATFAIAFCEGPVAAIGRIWVNQKVFVDFRGSAVGVPSGIVYGNFIESMDRNEVVFEIHKGTEDQAADATLVGLLTAAETPAYRGICYIVFIDFPVGEYSGVPTIEVEINGFDYASGSSLTVGYSPLRGTHEFTRENNFVCVQYTQTSTPDGGFYQTAVFNTHDKFTDTVLWSKTINSPAATQAYAFTKKQFTLRSWAVCPYTNNCWLSWTITYINGITITGYENVLNIYSNAFCESLLSTTIQAGGSWTSQYDLRWYFVGDFLWVVGAQYNSGYYTTLEKRNPDTGTIILKYNRVRLYNEAGALLSENVEVRGADGTYMYTVFGGRFYKFKPDDIIADGSIGEVKVSMYEVVWAGYSGSFQSWAGWYPAAADERYFDGTFNAFGVRQFLADNVSVGGSDFRIDVKNDPPV